MAWTQYADGDIFSETVVIANGASLSGVLNLRGYLPLLIVIPSAWTTANLTFQLATDGATFNALYRDGVEYTVYGAGASVALAIPQSEGLMFQGTVKVRSGSASSPVNQGGARSLTVIAAKLRG